MNFTPKSTAAHSGARQTLKHILLVMKLTTFLLIIALVQASAKGYSQITLHEKNAPLEKVFKEIKQQSGYAFIYENSAIDQTKISLDVNNASLESTLKVCFANLPLTYKIVDKAVVIQQKETSFIDKVKEAAKAVFTNIDVTGRVLDEQGLPIPSATVTVKGTSNATITDAKGYFVLKGVDDKSIILISVIGYEKREISAKNNIGDIKLVVATTKLDEVHIIPYGQTTQRLTVGNIGSVSAKVISEQPIQNPLLALEGRIPGLFITQASGINGGGVNVRIQGQNSIAKGSDPLFIVDGVPYQSQMLKTTMIGSDLLGGLGGPGQSPLNFINPGDIQSIEVLKDADATAIYGSRGANGVILITTKTGSVGEQRIDVNIQQGVQFTPRITEMSTSQYLAMRREAFRNDGLIPSSNPSASGTSVYAPDLMFWDTTRYTNWQKELLKSALYTNVNASISGGTVNNQYLIGGSYNNQGAGFPGDYNDQKGTLHFNLTTTSANKKFKIQLGGTYLVDDNRLPSTDLTNTALTLPPDAPVLYNTDGTLNWQLNSTGNSTWTNPLNFLYQKYSNKTSNLIGNLLTSYELMPGLQIASTFGYNKLGTDELKYRTLESVPPASRGTAGILSANFANNTVDTWSIEPQVSYKTKIGKGFLNLLIGSTFQEIKSNGLNYTGSGYSTIATIEDIKSAATVTINSSLASVYKYNALFSRLGYTWDDKYIIDLTARRDGSSRFGENNLFHNFWSVGGAWIFSEEKLIKDNFSFLSYGKFRASYGTTGNDQIGDYQYLSVYNSLNNGINYQGSTSLTVNATTGLSNPNFQWEETRKMQFGIDFGFVKDRLLLNATYSRNRSSNELLNYQLPSITGFSSIIQNFPATIQNTSWEFSLNSINSSNANFSWSTSLNLTIPRNELVDFPNLASSTYSGTVIIGQPLGVIKAPHFLGVDPATGLYQFADRFGNPTASPSALDANNYYTTLPTLYGGFQNSLRYKSIQVDLFFQFVKQKGTFAGQFGSSPGTANNGPESFANLSHWQQPGDITSIQRYSTNNSNVSLAQARASSSDAAIVDASYIRLKNVSVSYALPQTALHIFHIKTAKIYLQAQNLMTITSYPGSDPENQSSIVLPPKKTLVFGMQAGF